MSFSLRAAKHLTHGMPTIDTPWADVTFPPLPDYHLSPDRNRLVYGPPNGSLPLKLATELAVYPIESNLLEDLGHFETIKILPSKDTYTSLSNLVLSLPKIFFRILLTVYSNKKKKLEILDLYN
ncbi:hypothetical protein L209DRAFT_738976 [Thermothelomyces heterothallicus CBS 203.75]